MNDLRKAAQAALEVLRFYANGEHEETLTGFSGGKRLDWDSARRDLANRGFEFRGENYNSTENYVETGKKAYAAAQGLEAALAEPQPEPEPTAQDDWMWEDCGDALESMTCPWCDRQGTDICQHADDAKNCEKTK